MVDLSFCEYHSYPSRIREQIRKILSVIDPSKVRSVIVRGSTSSGELGFRLSHNNVEIYSDYEFSVVPVKKLDKGYEKKLNEHASMLQKEFATNPLFKIDFFYGPLHSLRDGIVALDIVDRNDGFVVFGEDVRNTIPELTARTLNRHLLNEILLWLLWRNILLCPVEMLVCGDIPEQKKVCWNYTLCKNCLLISSWVLPLEGVFLSSYRRRIEYIAQYYDALEASAFFDVQFADLLRECYIGKTKILFRDDSLSLYDDVLRCCLSSKRYLLAIHRARGYDSFSDKQRGIFNDNCIMRIVYDMYLGMLKAGDKAPKERIQWILSSKCAIAVDFLFSMNLSLNACLHQRVDEAKTHLVDAQKLFRKLALKTPVFKSTQAAPFAGLWLSLRDCFAEFLSVYVPGSRAYHEKILAFNSLNMESRDRCRRS